jgi:hypothetical protein
MWPFKGDTESRLQRWLDRIAYEQIEAEIPISKVMKAIIFEELKDNE